jgi:plasmid stabilization system protein ParE
VSDTPPKPHPLRLIFTATASASVREAADWLLSFSPQAAQRFATILPEELSQLCQRWGEGYRPLLDDEASLFFSRPVFQHRFRTSQTRRTNTGVWRIFYDVSDTDQDGQPDTLRVLTVRHAASRPLSIESDEGE